MASPAAGCRFRAQPGVQPRQTATSAAPRNTLATTGSAKSAGRIRDSPRSESSLPEGGTPNSAARRCPSRRVGPTVNSRGSSGSGTGSRFSHTSFDKRPTNKLKTSDDPHELSGNLSRRQSNGQEGSGLKSQRCGQKNGETCCFIIFPSCCFK
ncbi:unnamed protein product [Protopolystoma xenopodis]|uniref:Uncharacterized protein n=1 Tax=Protopolystoma xenopodis TaxID=117903 RepID=A0A3S5AAL2_9PLAT|nr:unnamed protein product [Protopolystoma xenopodis]